MDSYNKSGRNQIRRLPKRAHYDKNTIYEILDAASICHVGFAIQGQPYVIPTAFGRDRDCIYIHGSSKSRMLQELKSGIPVCLTVTHLDGLVLARSSFHHSMNYRSAVVFGTATEVEGEEKLHGLFVISENILKGRWKEVREPNSKEMKVTTVVKIKIEEASAKVRSGPPGDDEKDYALSVWAGVIPVGIKTGPPVNDPLLRPGIDLSESVKALYVI